MRRSIGDGIESAFFFILIGFILIGMVGLKMSVNSDDAVKAAGAFGFRDVDVTDVNRIFPSLAGCGNDDMVSVNMTATSTDGRKVDIVACGGVWKGWTVRLR